MSKSFVPTKTIKQHLTRCAAVCARVISTYLQNLPQCSDRSLICGHFRVQLGYYLALLEAQAGMGAPQSQQR